MGLGFGLSQFELAAPGYDFFAVEDELLDEFLEVQELRLAPDDGQQDDPEGDLHLGVLEELVQDHLGHGIPLELDDDPHSLPVRLVPQVGDPLDPLILDQLGDPLQELGLVHLVGNLGDDDGLPLGPLLPFDQRPGPDLDHPFPRQVGLPDPAPAPG